MMKSSFFLITFLMPPMVLNALSWFDLPFQPLTKIFHISDHCFQQLESDIADYHAVVKDDIAFLEERCQRLTQISNFAAQESQKYLEGSYQKESLECVQSLAQNKADYLRQLKYLYDSPVREGGNKHPSERLLSHKFMYSAKRKELVGGFEYECADPCHRQLAGYVALWEACSNDSRPPFFLWLETQYVPEGIAQTVFVNPQELEKSHMLIADNGHIYLGQDGMAHTPLDHQHGHIFVIDTQGQCYLGLGSQSLIMCPYQQEILLLGLGLFGLRKELLKRFFCVVGTISRAGNSMPKQSTI